MSAYLITCEAIKNNNKERRCANKRKARLLKACLAAAIITFVLLLSPRPRVCEAHVCHMLTPDQAARQLSGDDLTLLLEAKRKEDAALEEAPADADLEGRIGKNPISYCKHGTAGPG